MQVPLRALPDAPVHRRRPGIADAGVLRVAHHADDLELAGLLERLADAAAEGVAVREQRARGRFVEDRHLRRRRAVAVGEAAALQHGNAHRREERRRDVHPEHRSSAGACDVCPCFHVEPVNVVPDSSGARVRAADVTPGSVAIRSSTWPKSREERSTS